MNDKALELAYRKIFFDAIDTKPSERYYIGVDDKMVTLYVETDGSNYWGTATIEVDGKLLADYVVKEGLGLQNMVFKIHGPVLLKLDVVVKNHKYANEKAGIIFLTTDKNVNLKLK